MHEEVTRLKVLLTRTNVDLTAVHVDLTRAVSLVHAAVHQLRTAVAHP